MKRIWGYLPLLFCPVLAHAQSAVDVNVGFGSAFDSAKSGSGIDNVTFLGCVPGSAVTCQSTPSLSGFFLGFGGDVMFREHFGAGAEVSFQPAHQNYGPLQYRQTFFDVNGIYEPLTMKRAIVQLQGGVGTATTGFIFSQTGCVGTAVCTNSVSPVGSSTHFQVHFGAGVQIPIKDHFFVRPQFDLHYVPGLTNQFGSDLVPEVMVSVGYHLGER